MLIIERHEARSVQPAVPGQHTIEMANSVTGPTKQGKLSITVDGTEVAKMDFNVTVLSVMTAIESFSAGVN